MVSVILPTWHAVLIHAPSAPRAAFTTVIFCGYFILFANELTQREASVPFFSHLAGFFLAVSRNAPRRFGDLATGLSKDEYSRL
ncbi:hypothetical protein BRADI_3g45455v3 [Brachypodium distachyon]|uniref:Uncharacterized protein n=1 Tax=Brachypodium distachyon TaxID=15368 RepID=A0A2K2D3E9_BRADI|nr:hypothetical protein BRADI_3g45455v3 [Brachypodium distachyon]